MWETKWGGSARGDVERFWKRRQEQELPDIQNTMFSVILPFLKVIPHPPRDISALEKVLTDYNAPLSTQLEGKKSVSFRYL